MRSPSLIVAVAGLEALSWCSALFAGQAPASSDPGSVAVGGIGGTIYYGVAQSSSGASGGTAPEQDNSGADYALVPVVEARGTGFCVSLSEVPVSGKPAPATDQPAAAGQPYGTSWPDLLALYPLCPGALQNLSVSPPAAALAASYWDTYGEDLLPRPEPFISPGYALTGNPAYLESHLPMSATFANPTVLGTLTITASAQLWVDWGDGTGWQGPFNDAGAPWPAGDVTHTWDLVGSYDVSVRASWAASWSLGAEHGTLTDLTTEGTLEGFPVRQLESVRNR